MVIYIDNHILRPRLLDMIDSLQKVSDKNGRVLCGREVAKSLHSSVHASWDLITSLLRHCWSIGPVVLASKHVYWASFGIDACHTGTAVPP